MVHKKKMAHSGKKIYRNTHGTIYKLKTKKRNPAIARRKQIAAKSPVKA
jgi:hypothetical protein